MQYSPEYMLNPDSLITIMDRNTSSIDPWPGFLLLFPESISLTRNSVVIPKYSLLLLTKQQWLEMDLFSSKPFSVLVMTFSVSKLYKIKNLFDICQQYKIFTIECQVQNMAFTHSIFRKTHCTHSEVQIILLTSWLGSKAYGSTRKHFCNILNSKGGPLVEFRFLKNWLILYI